MYGLAVTAGTVAAWEEKVRFHLPQKLGALAVVATAGIGFQWLLSDRRRRPPHLVPHPARRAVTPMLLVGVGVATGTELASTVAVVSAFYSGPAVGVVVVIAAAVSMVGLFSSGRGAIGPGSPLMVAGLATTGMALPAAVGATLVVKLLQIWVPVGIGRLLARPLGAAVGR